LKLDAAMKQSMAARTGDEKLKLEAAKEQSRADKARIAALKLLMAESPNSPSGMLRQRSGEDVSLKKVKNLSMSNSKSANNVSLPKMPLQPSRLSQQQPQQQEEQPQQQLETQPLPLPTQKKQARPHFGLQAPGTTQVAPSVNSAPQKSGMQRQKSASNVSHKSNNNGSTFYKYPKTSASGNDISLVQQGSWIPQQQRPWSPPHRQQTAAVPVPQGPFYTQQRQWSPPHHEKRVQISPPADSPQQQGSPSPSRSEQLQWRKPAEPTPTTVTPAQQDTSAQPQKQRKPKQQDAQQQSDKQEGPSKMLPRAQKLQQKKPNREQQPVNNNNNKEEQITKEQKEQSTSPRMKDAATNTDFSEDISTQIPAIEAK